jgi:hypothetical protein
LYPGDGAHHPSWPTNQRFLTVTLWLTVYNGMALTHDPSAGPRE